MSETAEAQHPNAEAAQMLAIETLRAGCDRAREERTMSVFLLMAACIAAMLLWVYHPWRRA